MLNISWKAGPALGLGQLGHCLGPPPIEKGPKFGSKNCFYFLFYYIYIYKLGDRDKSKFKKA